MNIAFYTGASGIFAHQEFMNVTGNNISNANTIGYKAQQADFENLIYKRMYVNSPKDPLVGVGTKIREANMIFNQGTPNHTEQELDFCIIGDGFFSVEYRDQVFYTRNGNFIPGESEGEYYLCMQNGAYVLDKEGERILLEKDEATNSLILDGLLDRIGIYQFNNQEALLPYSHTLFRETEQSGEAFVFDIEEMDEESTIVPPLLKQRYLEFSGTNLSDEMTNMILAQRGYQMSARVLQTADQMEDIVSNLRQ